MKSKLLQEISYSQTHQSDALLDDQQENTRRLVRELRSNTKPPNPVNLALDAQARSRTQLTPDL
jgi:hypothetical protein